MRRIIITDQTCNGRGFKILTQGLELKRYRDNPVMLWMHQRGNVIGQMRDIRVEGQAITAEPWFDEVTTLSKQIKAQYEAGSVRAASVGIDVMQVEEEKDSKGNTIPVVTKAEIFEVSLVDVPENPQTVTLRHRGKDILPQQLLTLAKEYNKQQLTIKQKEMELQQLIALLALGEGATEEDVRNAILKQKEQLDEATQKLALAEKKFKELSDDRKQEQLKHVRKSVEKAIREQRITEDRKNQYIELGKTIGPDALQDILDDMPQPKRIVEMLQHNTGNTQQEYKKLSDVPESEILTLRKEQPETYAKLYRQEYGIDFHNEEM